MTRKRWYLAAVLALVAFAAYAQNTYHGFTEPSDWAAQSGGKTFKPWYEPADPDNAAGTTLEHGRASGFSTSVFRPESYGAKYNEKSVKQAKANSKAIEDIKAAMPDTGGTILLRDELYTWGTIELPERTIIGSARTIPFEIRGEGRDRTRIINLEPDVPAIDWEVSATSPTQHVSGHPAVRLTGVEVISQGGGGVFTGLGKLLEVHDVAFSRCHGVGMTLSQLYGGSFTQVYCIGNYGKGADIDSCNIVDLDLITRLNLDDGIEISNCTGLRAMTYNEHDAGWGVDADTVTNSTWTIYLEANRFRYPFTVTANATNNDFTATDHGLALRDLVQFSSTVSLPGGISAAPTFYYVAGTVTANTFQVSTTATGAAVDLSSAGSGIVRCDPFDYTAQPQARFRNCHNLDLAGFYAQDSGYSLDLDPVSFIGIRQQRDPDWPAATALALGNIADNDNFIQYWSAPYQPTYTVLDADSFQLDIPAGMFNHSSDPGTYWIEQFTNLDDQTITAGDWLDVTLDVELDATAAAYYKANPKNPVLFIQIVDPNGLFTTDPTKLCYHYQSVNTMRFHARGQATGTGSGLRLLIYPTAVEPDDGNDTNVPATGFTIKVHNISVHKVSQ